LFSIVTTTLTFGALLGTQNENIQHLLSQIESDQTPTSFQQNDQHLPEAILLGSVSSAPVFSRSLLGEEPTDSTDDASRKSDESSDDRSGDGGGGGGGFDPFTLPIELSAYTAKVEGNSVRLDWTTATEINNRFFTLERSRNGISYEVVAEIDGAGTSSTEKHYAAFDEQPLPGTTYYKLIQTDMDGTSEEVGIVSATYEEGGTDCEMKIIPNPCRGKCDITLTGCSNDDFVQIALFDTMGKEIRNAVPIKQGNGFFINASNNLAPGTYIVYGATMGSKVNQKVIIQ